MPELVFSRLPSGSLDGTIEALRKADLPVQDIVPERMIFFVLADPEGPVGWAGLERCGPDALLRSVLTAERGRGRGCGRELIRRVGEAAAQDGVERVWLLTETAAPFFEKLGFRTVDRDEAPAGIRQTSEFRDTCPVSATCMTLALDRP